VGDAEFSQQFIQHSVAGVGVFFDHFQNRADIIFDRQARKIEASCGR